MKSTIAAILKHHHPHTWAQNGEKSFSPVDNLSLIHIFPANLERYGNTSGASVPILLDELNREGKLKPGDKLLLAGFGAGLTWGTTLLEW